MQSARSENLRVNVHLHVNLHVYLHVNLHVNYMGKLPFQAFVSPR